MPHNDNMNDSKNLPNGDTNKPNTTYSISDNQPRNEQIPAVKPRKKEPKSTDGQNQK